MSAVKTKDADAVIRQNGWRLILVTLCSPSHPEYSPVTFIFEFFAVVYVFDRL